MKKNKLIVAGILASTLAFSAIAFTACGDEDGGGHKCGNVCPTCQKCLTDCEDEVCKDKCEGHNAAVDMTQGVYTCKMGSYDLTIKFYNATDYYLQNETTGFRGKYEIKDEEITFSATQADGSVAPTGDPNPEVAAQAKWITGNKTIYFYQEDGETPIAYTLNACEESAHNANVVPSGIGYAYGTKPNTLAYNTETDSIQSLRGNNASRTLSHSKDVEFTIDNEKDIYQERFMVKTLPLDAKKGDVESDYWFKLTQKGYETNIKEIRDWGIKIGSFSYDEATKTYTLTDTLTDGATATLELNDKGGATVKKADQSVELVKWEEVASYAARLENTRGMTLSLNEDGTLNLKGSITISGTYRYEENELSITLDENTYGATVTECTVNGDDVVVKIAVTSPVSMTLEFSGKVTGTLYTPGAKVLLTAASEEAVFGSTKMDLEMKSDCTLALSVGGQEKVTAFWYLDATKTLPTMTFKASSGTFAFQVTGQTTAKITWTGKLSDTQETDSVYTFNIATTDLSALTSAKIAEKYAVTTTVAKLGNQEVTLTFLADNTFTVANPKLTIATGEWTLTMNGQVPSLTFSNVSSGTATGAFASDYTVTWSGSITTQTGAVEVEIAFAFPASDFAKLQ